MAAPVSFAHVLTLIMFLLGGGKGDLLDYLSIDGYWKTKNVTVDAAAMLKELAPRDGAAVDLKRQIENLGSEFEKVRELAAEEIVAAGPAALPQLQAAAQSPDAQQAQEARRLIEKINGGAYSGEIRKLMAIRTLGELHHKPALSLLAKLATSDDAFIPSYARNAIAAIDAAALKPDPGAAAALTTRLAGDAALLPSGVGLVVQYRLNALKHVSLDDLAQAPGAPGVAPISPEKLEAKIIDLVEHVGNVRLDAATFAMAKEVGRNVGFMTVVARGRFDKDLMKALKLPEMGYAYSRVGDVDVYRRANDSPAALLVPSNDRVILVAGDPTNAGRIDELLAALKTGAGKIAEEKDLMALMRAADKTGPIWGAAEISDSYRGNIPGGILEGVESVTLSSKVKDGHVELAMNAACGDAEKSKAANETLDAGLKTLLARGDQVANMVPAIQPLVEFLRGVQSKANGDGVALTGKTADLCPGRMLLPPFMMFMQSMMGGMEMEQEDMSGDVDGPMDEQQEMGGTERD